jgi:hypothetical protein
LSSGAKADIVESIHKDRELREGNAPKETPIPRFDDTQAGTEDKRVPPEPIVKQPSAEPKPQESEKPVVIGPSPSYSK